MVWVAAPNGRTLYFNQQGLDYTGAPGHMVSWDNLVHPDDLERSTSCWAAALRTKSGFEEDFRIRRFDGVYLWHNSRSRPLLDADGRITRWIGTATEIDDQKRLEHDLVTAHREAAEAVTLLATLQDAAPMAFGFVDLDDRVVRLNEVMATFVGAPLEELVGQKVIDTAPELWAQLQPIFRHVA